MKSGGKDIRSMIADWFAAARANPRFFPALAGASSIALIDQASKAWIVDGLQLPARIGGRINLSPVFDLTYVQNFGASFGLLAGGAASRAILSLVSVGVSVALIIWLARIERRIAAIGIAFIVGGAVGNLVDRVSLGYVVDFLDFSGLYFPWVFNVADAAINVGVSFLLLDAWQTRGGENSE